MIRLLLLAALCAPLASSALAQEPERETERRPAATEEQKKAEAAARDEAAKREAEGPEVTYEMVLAKPEDLELNFRWAKAQVRAGDLQGASATLERILLLNPALDRIRLFHAIVFYRLDNLIEAQRELETLKKKALPEELKDEVEKYSQLVTRRRKATSLTGRIGVGYSYEVNRNASPASGTRLLFDFPIQLGESSLRKDDTATLFTADVEARHTLKRAGGHQLFGGLTYYQAEQTAIKVLNLKAFSARAGGVIRTSRADITPSLQADHVQLAQETYLRTRGVGVRADRRATKRLTFFGELKDTFQDYVATTEVPIAGERTGVQVDAELGFNYVLNPSMRLGSSLAHTVKHASRSYNAFFRDQLRVNHLWLLGKGTFLLSSGALGHDQYKDADTAISAKPRRDKTARLTSTFGAPLGLLHPALKDLLWTFSYEYYEAVSNVTNYEWSNNKIATFVTYKWDLGL